MNKVNLIIVFNQAETDVLMCYRMKEPYKGLYNFVGGKVYHDEDDFHGAYRELYEETGITINDIDLSLLFKTIYPKDSLELQVYYGVLNKKVKLKEELNPLKWIARTTNFCDSKKFAGDGNIQHMMQVIEYNEKLGI